VLVARVRQGVSEAEHPRIARRGRVRPRWLRRR
jgi:hypothetical protein